MSRPTTRDYADTAGIEAGTAVKAAELALRQAQRAEKTVADTPRRLAEQEQATAAERTRRELVGEERTILQRLAPRRNVWPDLIEHDQRVAELDAKLAGATAAVRELEDEHAVAERNDHETLTRWHAAGAQGARPEPTAPTIRHELEQRQADVAALGEVAADAAEQRARFIEHHRDRLAGRADKLADQTQARYLDLVTELATARDDLLAYTAAARFARTFPDPAASAETSTPVSLQPAGQRTLVAFDQLLTVLRADADRLALRRDGKNSSAGAGWVSPEDDAKAAFAQNKARLLRGEA